MSHSYVLHGLQQPELLRLTTLADLFEATAKRFPQKTALIFGEHSLSYAELNALADRAAHRLIEAGARAGHIIGLWLPRGIDLLVMQLAIAKTGAAWLPFDADTPVERIAVCLDDAEAFALVSCASLQTQLSSLGTPVHVAEHLLASLENPAAPLRRRIGTHPYDTAYVIYTSGSTGKPKGIAISQGSICHFLQSENAVLGVRDSDRVYQGFSVAFDMSFEEIWISYLAGAALWIAPKEIASDPEALPRALDRQHITVLHAVPTLLALFTEDVPSLRIINLGGEMCPESLVRRWALPGRQMFNTYGPTEATVSASLAQLNPGEPVTIGQPLPNYGLLVVATDEPGVDGQVLRILPHGETGELCITGPGVAAGYLGRPELTREKFLPNPWSTGEHDQRLYRTGDLARIDANRQVHCLGRADDQIKIRGFRVELGEIEAVLAQQPGIGTAAVVLRQDQGIDQLIAFWVAGNGQSAASDAAPNAEAASSDAVESANTSTAELPVPLGDGTHEGCRYKNTAELRTALGLRLPPYMVPARFERLTEMPRLASGKIDRKALKAMPLAVRGPAEGSDAAQGPAEVALFAALETLFPGQAIRRELDFFSDLGGHSLFAARLASALRADPRFAQVTVRDIYQNRQIGALSQALAGAMARQASDTAAGHVERTAHPTRIMHSRWRRWRCGVAQAFTVPFLVTFKMAQWLIPFFCYQYLTGDPGDSIKFAVIVSIGAYLLATIVEFILACAAKWLILGRLKPGRYPLWGVTYFRWWLTDRILEAAPLYMLNGSSLYVYWLRALGAKIGNNVLIGSTTLRVPDLLTIGDGVSIGNGVNLENARVQNGELILGAITIEDEASLGSYVVMEGNTHVAEWGHVQGQSALRDGTRVPTRRIWGGSPATDHGEFDPASLPPRPIESRSRIAGKNVYYVLGALLISILFFVPLFPTFMLVDYLDIDNLSVGALARSGFANDYDVFALRLIKYFLLALPASVVMVVLTALVAAGIRWALLPKLKPGRYPVNGNVYLYKWLVNQIQESSLQVLHGVYATVFSSTWYRLLGAKVGRDAEISTALGVVPDMLSLGDETFIADAVMLGDEHIDGGWMTVQPTVIARRSFVGNGTYIPDGTNLPENVLIGVLSSLPRDTPVRNGDTWLGSPPLNLPARETVQGFPEELTYHPSQSRRWQRGLVETFRIVAPHSLVIAAGYAIVLDVVPIAGAGHWLQATWELAVSGLLFGLATFLFVAFFKWVLLGRYKRCAVPMWTPFVWLSEATTNMYEGIAVPNFLRYLRGTPFLPKALNLLGAHIGRGVYLDTTDMTEFDCVYIGDYSELNALCCPQTHLFEDRVMKIDDVRIGARAYMGPRSTVLYSAIVADDVHLGPLTLVMKGENIPAGTAWHGCPAMPQSDPPCYT
ncbi:Pls/PosA family non-ribosomal peptide synthetase [Paralcaligenes ureilyticus]|uniref:Non-ribosomal peptide synthetase-like protein n=1 Tax=Paralcaligenes ureilyticus TaxID=627131 RepID=A0A4R3M5E0_9BURK|nr:Pls/PosA family non-ribosomal peptide synthetase [Paralcaligenes ureilyticus]TCT08594.1 non-ribosomal peptide synthetase-like protein [Paralcaligenes ureilyticus]